jgi:surface polysaccharide O-acyltransferase-like enzyme
MNKDTSRIIELLRFPLIVGVVLIHASNTEVSMADSTVGGTSGNLNLYVQNLFSQVFARVAVPAFFLISGYLLFLGKDLSWGLVKDKWKKRVFTLFIPFLFWNLVILMVQYVGQSTPKLSRFFSGSRWDVDQMSWIDFADALLGFHYGPINYPLWFIRDLMILIILSPLIVLALTYSKRLILLVPLAWWLGMRPPFPIFVSIEALLFFSIGLMMSPYELVLKSNQKIIFSGLFIYLALAFLEAYFQTTTGPVFFLHKANILLGCVLIFYLASIIKKSGRIESILLTLAASSFFVYVAHESLLQVFRKLFYVAIKPNNDVVFLAIYFAAPAVAMALLVAVYFWIVPWLPGWLQKLSLGSRKK